MKTWYSGLENRYASFSEDIQILNVVSDLNKAKNLTHIDSTNAKQHLFGAIILLDYIIDDPKWKPKLRELLRLREAVGSLIFLEKPYGTIDQIITATLLMEPQAYRAIKKVKHNAPEAHLF